MISYQKVEMKFIKSNKLKIKISKTIMAFDKIIFVLRITLGLSTH